MSDDGFLPGLIFGAVVAAITVGWAVGDIKNDTINQLKEDAAKKGCAEYFLDKKHQSQWRWIK